ncbi:putative ABC exporter domain-containing protein [Pyxidicoccus xibeiensis]|uniref:putative ABC exporter domain-containing protein n=1 Tax=Pyxidicoccus xibeiensis TaxID=2906759 RepID=UPI0020A75A21|nr:putative ABC exporter domain-containing protein [Pyxidicoccus xibeiensis]MCP3144783.1 putative ABC exporter domain-containing protein [Pyxidicoccus xibeiensis]
MSFPGAVLFLWRASWRNRVLRQVRRLKRPRYLLGALVGLAYVAYVFSRGLSFRGVGGGASPGARLFTELSLVVSALGTVFAAWALGRDRPSLSFTETEVVQLFPAPIPRRALLHYKLVRGLLGTVVGALFATLFVGRVVSAAPVLFFLGSSLGLGTLYLHSTAASFMRTRLAARGRWGVAVRWGAVALVLAAVVLAGLAALRAHPMPDDLSSSRELRTWLRAVLDSPGLAAVLWPGQVLVAPALARDVGAFLRALPPVLGLLAAHYGWVLLAEVPFEETAVVRAEAHSRARALRGSGQLARVGKLTLRRPPFRLLARGRPEVALVWKNLIARRRMGGGVAMFVVFVVLGGAIAALLGDARLFTDTRRVVGPLALTLAVVMTVMGPSAFRVDLRMDLPKLDLLRAMPLTGRQVVGAELAASALSVAFLQLLLLGVALVLGPGEEEARLGEWWWPGGVALAVFLPAVALAGLFVQNAAVVLFPAWVPPAELGERPRGLEAMGQRLLALVGTMVVTLLGLLPAAVVALLVGLPLASVLGPWVLPVAGVAAAAVLVGEVWLGVVALGRAFEGLDVSEDRPE